MIWMGIEFWTLELGPWTLTPWLTYFGSSF